jgi:phytoene dehydrogenase-like protein
MENKRIAIVGGGITGIFAALLYSKKGFKVTLIEKENKLGGLLCSQNLFKENLSYDFGTHFLRQTGIKEIDEILFDELEVTHYNYIKSGTFYKTLYAKNGFLSDQKIPQREKYFKQLKDLSHLHNLSELSMGMSNDYISAIQNGATYVRIGSAIFNKN